MKIDMNAMSSNLPSSASAPTLDDMLAAVDAALAIPDPIGTLHGAVVYLRHDKRELSWGDTAGVSVDHPYIKGTPIHDAALRRLGEKA